MIGWLWSSSSVISLNFGCGTISGYMTKPITVVISERVIWWTTLRTERRLLLIALGLRELGRISISEIVKTSLVVAVQPLHFYELPGPCEDGICDVY